MKKRVLYTIIVILLFAVGFYLSFWSPGDELKTIKRTQILLGTVVEITVKNTDEETADKAITKAFDEIKRVDTLFSTYNSASPVYKLNHSRDSILTVPQELYNLIQISDSLNKISKGAFDISINSLIKAWGFETGNPSLPDKQSIDSALTHAGWKKITRLQNFKIARLDDVGLNFGAIAKGYAVDRAIKILKEQGIEKALVNAGGEIRGYGEEWIIGIQHPRFRDRLLVKIKLHNKSVATSGDYEQYFIENGKRYHHIIDPDTGYPADELQSVTVISDNDTFADGLSTAAFVLGFPEGMELIESLSDTEAMFVDSSGVVSYSTGFREFLVE